MMSRFRSWEWAIFLLLFCIGGLYQSSKGFNVVPLHAIAGEIVGEDPNNYKYKSTMQTMESGGAVANETSLRESTFPHESQYFLPGDLSLSRKETLRRCYVDPARYGQHMRGYGRCVQSMGTPRHKSELLYLMIAKAGSSAARDIMGKLMNGREGKCPRERQHHGPNRTHFSFCREPSFRFVSSYEESLYRALKVGVDVPHKYEEGFLGGSLGHISSYKEYTHASIQTKNSAFEAFLEKYDGFAPFEGHLRLQAPRMAIPSTGLTHTLDFLTDSQHLSQYFASLINGTNDSRLLSLNGGQQQKQSTKSHVDQTHRGVSVLSEQVYARSAGRKVNFDSLSLKARRKICRLTAIDYCCLNYPLPEACQRDGDGENPSVRCRWVTKPNISDEWLIEPFSPLPVVKTDPSG